MREPFAALMGFSMIELLTVIVIISILAALGAVGFQSIVSGRNIAMAGNMIIDQIALAQQTATAKNARVRWQIISVADNRNGDPEAFRLTRLQMFFPKTRAWQDIGSLKLLPPAVLVVSNESTLLTTNRIFPTQLPSGLSAQASSIVFFGNGLSDLNPNEPSSLTLRDLKNSNNFLTLQIDPVSGRLRTFQQ